jgi:hypothetical protein
VRASVLAIAEVAKTQAIALSADFRVTGEYMASFNVRSDTQMLKTGFGSHPVAAGILENLAPYAAAVEWGNAHDHKPHRVLGRVLTTLATL